MSKKNIIVLLSEYDLSREVFFLQSDEYNVKIMTPRDLSLSGWYYDDSEKKNSICAVGSDILPESEIAGVITRLPGVMKDQLPHIIPADRSYLASEMKAFLLAWLTSLTCPVLNRPTASCLSGLYRRPEQWVYYVAKMGIPVVQHVQAAEYGVQNKSSSTEEGVTVVIIGDQYLGDVHPHLVSYAKSITKANGIDFLAVNFNHANKDACFVSADLWPAITSKMAGLMFDFIINKHSVVEPGRMSLCV